MLVYQDGSFSYQPIYQVCFVFFISYVSMMIYQFFWLRGQLQNGFSQKYVEGNFLAKKSVQSVGSLAFIFSGTLLARHLTGDQANIFGMIANLMFIIGFSRVNLGYIYLAFLKWRSKDYWEKHDPENIIVIPKKKFIFFIRFTIEFIIFWVLVTVIGELPDSHPFYGIAVIAFIILSLYWFIRIALWLKRKIQY